MFLACRVVPWTRIICYIAISPSCYIVDVKVRNKRRKKKKIALFHYTVSSSRLDSSRLWSFFMKIEYQLNVVGVVGVKWPKSPLTSHLTVSYLYCGNHILVFQLLSTLFKSHLSSPCVVIPCPISGLHSVDITFSSRK